MIHIDYNDLVPWHFLFGEGNSLKNLKEEKMEVAINLTLQIPQNYLIRFENIL